jgi:DNA repair protein RadD
MTGITIPVLRDYQEHDVSEIRSRFVTYRRVLYVAPTGSGKTICFVYVVVHAARKDNRCIIITHRAEIADQISIALDAFGVPHGRIQPDHPEKPDALIQIAMVVSLERRIARIAEPALTVVDEAHHAVSRSWQAIFAHWTKTKKLGVSATPERLDGRGLRECFDTMVVGPSVRELIDRGYLARFRYLAPPMRVDLSRVRSVGGDFHHGELADAMDRSAITGDCIEHYRTHLDGRTAIAFCTTIAHAEHVAAAFRAAGITSASIDGRMNRERRDTLLGGLRSGDLNVLTSCELISEGFDAPAVGGAILLRPTQSLGLYLQQVGRCLRPKPDGTVATICDHVGSVRTHGLPDAERQWSLDAPRRRDSSAAITAAPAARAAPRRRKTANSRKWSPARHGRAVSTCAIGAPACCAGSSAWQVATKRDCAPSRRSAAIGPGGCGT